MTVEQLVPALGWDDVDVSRGRRDPLRPVRNDRHWDFLDFDATTPSPGRGNTSAATRRPASASATATTRRGASSSGQPEQPAWTQECGRGEPERLVVREGISPGYGDDYVPRLEGQWIDITGLPAGRYVLRHRVNVARALRESDYGDNSAEVPFDLTWSESGTPTVVAVYDG